MKPSNPKSKMPWLFPIALILYELPLYFATNMILPALPQISHTFAIKANIAKLTVAIWFLGASCLQVILGPLADHLGRRKILIMGGAFFILATLLCAITNSIEIFLLARFIQGCVVSSILVAGYATIHELMNNEQVLKTLAWMGSITVLSPAIGPLVGSFLLTWLHWRGLFFLLAAIACISIFLLFISMPETVIKMTGKRISWIKIIKDYKSVLSNKRFLAYTLPFCILFAAMMLWDTLSPFYLIHWLGLSIILFGCLQAISYAGFIIGTNLIRCFISKLDQVIREGLRMSTVFAILTALCFVLIPKQFKIVIFFLSLFMLSTGLIFYTLHRKAIESSNASTGIKVAVFSSAMNLFGFLGSLLANTIHLSN
ncbi:MFS transporter [Rickettsiella endosymbiont of Xylota segnis]|uniref:MFS transporter n=1 Tax=Rickettsiella endosymbiont of Xylota segnis TaxID=3066238 RepID=UPI0030D05859